MERVAGLEEVEAEVVKEREDGEVEEEEVVDDGAITLCTGGFGGGLRLERVEDEVTTGGEGRTGDDGQTGDEGADALLDTGRKIVEAADGDEAEGGIDIDRLSDGSLIPLLLCATATDCCLGSTSLALAEGCCRGGKMGL